MTSGEFALLPVSSIVVDRENRQRRELTDIDELAASIREVGLINPIVVTRDYVLVAGERRLAAHRQLGYTDIYVQWVDTLDKTELHLLELEENVKRKALTWQEEARAIDEYHRLQLQRDPAHTLDKTAEMLNVSRTSVGRHLTVAEEMKKDESLALIPALSTAHNAVVRKRERAATAVLAEVMDNTPRRRIDLLNLDFQQWAKMPQAEPFNLLHVDFPYGVTVGDKSGQSAAKHLGKYDDSADVYWSLLNTLVTHQDNFCAQSAHMVFWFSMKYYSQTIDYLERAGWSVNPTPLIWLKSDNAGIIPDANRGPRQIYETALLCTRGDRKIVKAVGNAFAAPTTKDFHTSEKSFTMLQHFFRMLVDEYSRVLDPTAGSGMAIRAAEEVGAAFALGIERDSQFYAAARNNLKLAN